MAKKPKKAFRKRFAFVFSNGEKAEWSSETFSDMLRIRCNDDHERAVFEDFAEECIPGGFITINKGENLVFCVS